MKIYTYKACGTCRKALKWLNENEILFEEIPIRETPPSIDELKTMLEHQNGELKKLFNTSGRDYREMNIKEKLPDMSTDKALELLASNGNLIKRPFLLTDETGLVGFREADWTSALLS